MYAENGTAISSADYNSPAKALSMIWHIHRVHHVTLMPSSCLGSQARAEQPAPSVQDLKEYSSKLREAVAVEEQRVAHEERVSKMFNAADEEPGRARRLRGMVSASRGEFEGE